MDAISAMHRLQRLVLGRFAEAGMASLLQGILLEAVLE
jgi:hypothetical protein